MKKTCLQMLPKSADYAAANDNDPLRFYYWPVLGKLYRRRVELCLELLPGGERVLEVGFGSGVSFLNLSGLYREIYGLDLEADCQGVSACFAARGVTAQLINGSVLELPYPDNFFDSVLLISILEHLRPEDAEQGLPGNTAGAQTRRAYGLWRPCGAASHGGRFPASGI